MSKKWKWKWNKHSSRNIFVSKVFWGLLLILIGIFMIISKMGIVKGISVWSVFFTVIFAALLIRGLIRRSFTSIFFAIAFLCIIYDDQLGITALTPWTVLLAALLLSVGMNILFHKKGSYHKYIRFMDDDVFDAEEFQDWDKGIHVNINIDRDDDEDEKFDESWETHEKKEHEKESMQGEKVYKRNSFGTCSKYIDPEMFESGMLENNFGSMNVFFENVATRKKEGFLDVDNSFGEINIYVPSSWMVDMRIEDNLGGNSFMNGHSDGSNRFLLHIKGDNSFGTVRIIYQ